MEFVVSDHNRYVPYGLFWMLCKYRIKVLRWSLPHGRKKDQNLNSGARIPGSSLFHTPQLLRGGLSDEFSTACKASTVVSDHTDHTP
jgi:hypothetical protein